MKAFFWRDRTWPRKSFFRTAHYAAEIRTKHTSEQKSKASLHKPVLFFRLLFNTNVNFAISHYEKNYEYSWSECLSTDTVSLVGRWGQVATPSRNYEL
jgi:hypothetical protein